MTGRVAIPAFKYGQVALPQLLRRMHRSRASARKPIVSRHQKKKATW